MNNWRALTKFTITTTWLLTVTLSPAWATSIFDQVTCNVPDSNLRARLDFIKKHRQSMNKTYEKIKREHNKIAEEYKSARTTQQWGDSALLLSAVAGIISGGATLHSLFLAKSSVSILGVSLTTKTPFTYLYIAYSVGRNSFELGTVLKGFGMNGAEIKEVLAQRKKEAKEGIKMPQKTIDMFFVSKWQALSTEIEPPVFNQAIDRLEDFYQQGIDDIGDNGGLWSYVTEFYHKRVLRRAILDLTVYSHLLAIKEMQMAYWDSLIASLKNHINICRVRKGMDLLEEDITGQILAQLCYQHGYCANNHQK